MCFMNPDRLIRHPLCHKWTLNQMWLPYKGTVILLSPVPSSKRLEDILQILPPSSCWLAGVLFKPPKFVSMMTMDCDHKTHLIHLYFSPKSTTQSERPMKRMVGDPENCKYHPSPRPPPRTLLSSSLSAVTFLFFLSRRRDGFPGGRAKKLPLFEPRLTSSTLEMWREFAWKKCNVFMIWDRNNDLWTP